MIASTHWKLEEKRGTGFFSQPSTGTNPAIILRLDF